MTIMDNHDESDDGVVTGVTLMKDCKHLIKGFNLFLSGFLTSLDNGIDVRITLRTWHKGWAWVPPFWSMLWMVLKIFLLVNANGVWTPRVR